LIFFCLCVLNEDFFMVCRCIRFSRGGKSFLCFRKNTRGE
jgi:hypothetical protein